MLKLKTKLIVVFLACTLLFSLFSVAALGAAYREKRLSSGTLVGASDTYKSSKYYRQLSAVSLTGDNPTDVLAIALSQLGYQESDTLDNLSGENAGTGNFTEYNYNFGDYGAGYAYYWCASFVSFCLYQAGCHDLDKLTDWCRAHTDDPDYIWKELGCEKWREALCSAGLFRTATAYKNIRGMFEYYDPQYVPLSGDLIFFHKSGTYTSGHIGIVLYATEDAVYTVEGNTSSASGLDANGGGVYAKSYPLSSTYILGYGDMPYVTMDDVDKPDYSGSSPTTGLYVSTTNKYIFFDPDDAADESIIAYNALLPRYTMFKVTDVISPSVLKAEVEINDKTVTGYVRNNSDRIIQLSCESFDSSFEDETESVGETQTETITESLTDSEIQTEIIIESLTDSEIQTETIVESLTESEIQTETIVESLTDSEIQTETIAENETITESLTESEIQTETASESLTEGASQTETLPIESQESDSSDESQSEYNDDSSVENQDSAPNDKSSSNGCNSAADMSVLAIISLSCIIIWIILSHKGRQKKPSDSVASQE